MPPRWAGPDRSTRSSRLRSRGPPRCRPQGNGKARPGSAGDDHTAGRGRATSANEVAPVISVPVDFDEGPDEDEPTFPWLPPDDRLWRHPSELAGNLSPSGAPGPTGTAAAAGP